MDITLEQAEKIVAAAKTKAKEIDTLMNIAVVDRGAHLWHLQGWTVRGWALWISP